MTIQDAILQIQLRADRWDDDSLVKSFVTVGPLIPLLNSENNQVIFGRRGTGKTHILRYFKNLREQQNDCCIFIDLRKMGSSNCIYADQSAPDGAAPEFCRWCCGCAPDRRGWPPSPGSCARPERRRRRRCHSSRPAAAPAVLRRRRRDADWFSSERAGSPRFL